MAYPYGPQVSPAVGNALPGLPRRVTVTVPTVNNQDVYAYKKVRLQKVGTQTSLGSVSTLLTDQGQPIPMGFGKFAFSRASGTSTVVDYGSTGILQVRSNSGSISGRSSGNAVFRGAGVGYWYNTSTSTLNVVSASGASGSTQSTLATITSLTASGTTTNTAQAYTTFVPGTTAAAVSQYGSNAVFLGRATIAGGTNLVVVLASLYTGAITAVLDLGSYSSGTDRTMVAVYKNMLTAFVLDTSVSPSPFIARQINLATFAVTNLTISSLSLSTTSVSGFCAYAANGAVWFDVLASVGSANNYTYGFATDSNGVAVDHAAVTTSNNTNTLYSTSSAVNPSFNEMTWAGGRWRDFDYNLVYGYSANAAWESATDIKSSESVLVTDTQRFQAMARARAPIAFMEASTRLPVSLSLVCSGTGDQSAGLGTISGYDAALCYLDNGYWILMTTDGDSAVPSYTGYLQLYKEA